MKTLEKNTKLWQTERHIHTTLLISLLLNTLSSTLGSHIKKHYLGFNSMPSLEA